MDNSEINRLLAVKKDRLRLALGKTNTGLFEWYPITNESYYSPTWFTMLGYEPDGLPHKYETWVNLLHPEDKSITEKLLEDFIHSQIPNFNIEFRMLAKNGGDIWIYDQGVAAERQTV